MGYQINKSIFLSHDLTMENRELMKKAQNFKKENGYKYLCMNDGKKLITQEDKQEVKQDNSRVMLVEEEDDLKNQLLFL
ncbi:hypothetical protein WA026_017407 [Henosepilachna vigintioctopunctata]|uniref:Uncharacterized protein n=1 Tax=Henosepilachna vigintioctopunctata TaxID=420089 RepID=A0AAW1V9R9_9CUCU